MARRSEGHRCLQSAVAMARFITGDTSPMRWRTGPARGDDVATAIGAAGTGWMRGDRPQDEPRDAAVRDGQPSLVITTSREAIRCATESLSIDTGAPASSWNRR